MGSMGATQAAEWEREVMSQLCEPVRKRMKKR